MILKLFGIFYYYNYLFYSNSFYFYAEEMEPISEEIYVKEEPEYDQVSYAVFFKLCAAAH